MTDTSITVRILGIPPGSSVECWVELEALPDNHTNTVNMHQNSSPATLSCTMHGGEKPAMVRIDAWRSVHFPLNPDRHCLIRGEEFPDPPLRVRAEGKEFVYSQDSIVAAGSAEAVIAAYHLMQVKEPVAEEEDQYGDPINGHVQEYNPLLDSGEVSLDAEEDNHE